MPNLRYVVIALKDNEVDQVVAKLNDLKLDAVATWLALRKDTFYGKRNEDWKPFNGDTIDKLINETRGYTTQTILVDKFDVTSRDYSLAEKVGVYFIDPFALFLDKYNKLTGKIDSLLATQGKCCLIMSYEVPLDIQKSLLETYSDVMSEVNRKYRDGVLHRIAVRVDDLKNFRNYLSNTLGKEDRPSEAAETQAKERLPYETTTVPR